ncbi:uncharacterized protein LOC111400160 [Olea europaea var. sylvestris]|uniref:uncharacterized protein LOC111400160 n=1 Tax=Olea europaea var. sylvestris TaxID=158386 RepID=UPI000C1D150E|nr:uncharacterized protein LOC111400160 [Olea europaea var. sylvestris]
MANRVRRMIREEVGDGYFCILVDEAQDASKREQMAIILRFVNGQGILTERYFDIKSVSDTTSSSLKNEIVNVLAQHELEVSKMRGQGYDGASNMQGAWNGLQALFLRDCPYTYYVYCFAHRLQLVLVYAANEVGVIWEFFSHLDNIISSFPKRITELQSAQRNEIEHMLATGERELGSGANQEEFLGEVKKYCAKHDIEIPDLESLYKIGPCRSRDPIIMKHHYHFDVFNEAIDYVLIELNTRFNDTSVELLTLSAALDPRNSFESFNNHDICTLVEKFYPADFTQQDIRTLEYELRHYELDMKAESRFKDDMIGCKGSVIIIFFGDYGGIETELDFCGQTGMHMRWGLRAIDMRSEIFAIVIDGSV